VSIRSRLARLENGGSRSCPECGGPWKPGDPIEYVVDWGDGEAPDPLPPCGRCGRERTIYIDWPDLPRQTPEEYARMEAAHKAMLAERWARGEPGGG